MEILNSINSFLIFITQALLLPSPYYVTIPMEESVSRNSMLYQVEGVNDKDLKDKAHPGQGYLRQTFLVMK